MTKKDEVLLRAVVLLVRCAIIGLRILSRSNKNVMSSSVDALNRKASAFEGDCYHLISMGGER